MLKSKVVKHLAFMHLFCMGMTTYVHSIPVHIGNFLFQWDFITLPSVFVITLYSTWRYGTAVTRTVIRLCTPCTLIMAYVLNLTFDTGTYIGIGKLFEYDSIMGQIALASMCAYYAGQSMTMWIYQLVMEYKPGILAPIAGMIAGAFYDSLLFFSVFSMGGVMSTSHWVNLAAFSTTCKSLVYVIFFVPVFLAVKYIIEHDVIQQLTKTKML